MVEDGARAARFAHSESIAADRHYDVLSGAAGSLLALLRLARAGNGEAFASTLAESVTRHLRGTDAVAPWTQGWLALLLVDAETTHLPLILDRLTARLATAAMRSQP